MIGYHGSYVPSGVYNIILEYADGGDLEQMFQKLPQLVNGYDVLEFWNGLLDVISALVAVHDLLIREDDNPKGESSRLSG